MVEQAKEIKVEDVPKEPAFNITLTQSEVARIVEALANSKNLQTFIEYHKGEKEYAIYNDLVEVAKGPQ